MSCEWFERTSRQTTAAKENVFFTEMVKSSKIFLAVKS